MTQGDLEALVRAARLAYFEPGAAILEPGTQRPADCYVIRQGVVRGSRPGPEGAASPLFELTAGEMFPLGALLGHRAVTSVYRAVTDTFCLVLPARAFDALVERSPPFRDFCTQRLAYLLQLLRASVQAEYVSNVTARRDLGTPLHLLARGAPVTVDAATALEDVLTTLEARRIGCLPVVDEAGRPLGIFTREDVIGRVVLPRRDLASSVGNSMSAPVLTLSEDATAADAALLMAQRGIRHVVLTDGGGRVSGVVSERDLFALHRHSVREISSALHRARDLPALIQCAADIRTLSHALVAQGVGSGPLTRMISSLNDQLTVRVLEHCAAQFGLSHTQLCWLGLGSEGRSEQTIATDQDNGLIFAHDSGADVARLREQWLPFARAVNDALDRCGYPLCKGGIMAGNPQWCLSLPEWRHAFARWIDRGDPDSLLAASIFFDFRPLYGDARLAHTLRDVVSARARATPRFLRELAGNALRNRPPLSWRGELVEREDASGAEGIDLKLFGAMPISDGARILALATGVSATNTLERLREAGPKAGVATADLVNWTEAFEYLQMLRLRTQHRRLEHALPPSANANSVPVASLSTLDRRVLKESLRQVRRLQQRLELDYP
ncbi:MAG: DUF294 nucleotidyltransferase-like domain-containing protein [Casimicrobiaceae bacterium]